VIRIKKIAYEASAIGGGLFLDGEKKNEGRNCAEVHAPLARYDVRQRKKGRSGRVSKRNTSMVIRRAS